MSPLYDISMLEEEEVVVAVVMEPMLRSVAVGTNDDTDKGRSRNTDVVVAPVGRDDEEEDDAEPIGPLLQRSPPSFINHWGANLHDDNSIHLDSILDDTTSSPSTTTTTITNNLWEVQPKTKLSIMSCLTIQEEDEEEELTDVEVEEKVDGLPVVVSSEEQQFHQSPPSFINPWGASLDSDDFHDLEDISLADTATTRTDLLVAQQMQSMVSCLTIREEEEEDEEEGEEELVDQRQQQPPLLPVRSIRRKNQHMSMISMISYLTTPEEEDDEDEEDEGVMLREDDEDDDDDSTISDYSCGNWSSKFPSQDDVEDDFTLYPATTNSEMLKDMYQQEKRQRRLRKKKQEQQEQQEQQQAEQKEQLESSVVYEVSKYLNMTNPTDTRRNTSFGTGEEDSPASGRTLSVTTENTLSTTTSTTTRGDDNDHQMSTSNTNSSNQTKEMNFLCQVMAMPKVPIEQPDHTLSCPASHNHNDDTEKNEKNQKDKKKNPKKDKKTKRNMKKKASGGVGSKKNPLLCMLQWLNCASRRRRSNQTE